MRLRAVSRGCRGGAAGCPPSSEGADPGSAILRDSPRFSARVGCWTRRRRREALDDERRLADAATALLDPLVHDVEGAEGTEGAEGGVPHPALTWRVRSLELALNAAMLAGDWSAAAERGARLVEDRVRAYGTRWHPRVALDLVTLGSARRERDDGWGDDSDSAGAVSAIRDATDVLESSPARNPSSAPRRRRCSPRRAPRKVNRHGEGGETCRVRSRLRAK